MRTVQRSLELAAALACLTFAAEAQKLKPPKQAASAEAASVLILVNDAAPAAEGTGRTNASVWVGESYAAKRGIPADRKSTRLNSSHSDRSRMPSSA